MFEIRFIHKICNDIPAVNRGEPQICRLWEVDQGADLCWYARLGGRWVVSNVSTSSTLKYPGTGVIYPTIGVI